MRYKKMLKHILMSRAMSVCDTYKIDSVEYATTVC